MTAVPPPVEVPPALVRKYDRPGPRYTSYPPVPVWDRGFDDGAFRAALAAASRAAASPLACYVHLPFCRHRCLFCACNVVITRRADVVAVYLRRLEAEIGRVAALLGDRRRVAGLHWGGGTPTHLSCSQIERLHSALAKAFDLEPGGEASVEVHPPVTTREQLALLRRLGFDRVSLGVQDLDRGVQALVERWQTVEQTERVLRWSRELAFSSVNFDLIYGLPGQSLDTWNFTLGEVERLRPDRLAIYSYAKVPWLKPHQRRIQEERLPAPPLKMELFRTARRRLLASGYVEIGFDHFALPSDDLARAAGDGRLYRSFMGYTARPAPESVGVGLSAISEIGGCYAQLSSKLNRWSDAVDAGAFAVERGWVLTPEDRVRKLLIERLLCNMEVSFGEIEGHSGRPFREEFACAWERLEEMERDGLVERRADSLRITPLGRTFARNVAMLFDAYLPALEESSGPRHPTFSRTV